MSVRAPTFYAWLSVATSIVTITLKFSAYALTGSVGLLSDAIEAVVNIVAALVALGVLTYSAAGLPAGAFPLRLPDHSIQQFPLIRWED